MGFFRRCLYDSADVMVPLFVAITMGIFAPTTILPLVSQFALFVSSLTTDDALDAYNALMMPGPMVPVVTWTSAFSVSRFFRFRGTVPVVAILVAMTISVIRLPISRAPGSFCAMTCPVLNETTPSTLSDSCFCLNHVTKETLHGKGCDDYPSESVYGEDCDGHPSDAPIPCWDPETRTLSPSCISEYVRG